MTKIRLFINRCILFSIILVQSVFFPVATFADTGIPPEETQAVVESTDSSANETVEPSTTSEVDSTSEVPSETIQPTANSVPAEPESSQSETEIGPVGSTGPTSPTGPDSPNGDAGSTYKYNETTGKWENDYYIWDPVTGQTKPKTPQKYSYNPDTGMWDTTQWQYNAVTGQYEENKYALAYNPTQSLSVGRAAPVGGSQVSLNSNNTGFFDFFVDARITNRISSSARTGDANMLDNTLGGGAYSGSAEAFINLLNILQSSWDPSYGDLATFFANINGDVFGDLFIDPSMLSGDLSMDSNSTNNLRIRSETNGTIENNIDAEAVSGDANVEGNTSAGDAVSGSARVFINIINIINSMISSGRSFVGVLNINGNLDGDILLPDWFINMLIAGNGPNSSSNVTINSENALEADINNNQTISNNISATATSGDTTVSGNTSAGSGTSGNATTNLVLLNLTGQQVVARNALLVFINVMGSWVGLILNAPSGTTAAALGGGVQNATVSSSNSVDIESTNNSTITNNINAEATSGDASVAGNSTAGNARSGDAEVGVNILNMMDSQLTLSDWFGVLFINVFGNWNGSFGVNTEAGNRPAGGMGSSEEGVAQKSVQQTAGGTAGGGVFRFVPRGVGTSSGGYAPMLASSEAASGTALPADQQVAILAANDSDDTGSSIGSGTSIESSAASLWGPIFGGTIAVMLLGLERYLSIRTRRTLV